MTEEDKIIARILEVLPPGSFELSTFLSVFRVRFSDQVQTACVTCGNAPELLLNRAFIAEHCRTDEHLFMLVMHELYHVILGHTALFPRATKIRNIVFDAVINAILCSLFPTAEFTSFFTDLYPADKMPYALLRPPAEDTPDAVKNALRPLYDKSGTGTYHDVFEVLAGNGFLLRIISGEAGENGDPILLGSHGEEQDKVSPELQDLIAHIVSKWPSPNRLLPGRDRGGDKRDCTFEGTDTPNRCLRRGLAQLMRRATVTGTVEVQARTIRDRIVEATSLIPDVRDRTRTARELLLGEALLSRSHAHARQASNRAPRSTAVYFDVSGSVAACVPAVAQALLPYCRRGRCSVQVFSTVVEAANARDLAAHRFTTTGGTDIDCVLEHVLSLPARRRPRAIIVITDGLTGEPSPELAARFRAARVRLYVGLVQADASKPSRTDLTSLATSFVYLGDFS